MGGFAIEVPDDLPESQQFLPRDYTRRWFVPLHGIRKLVDFSCGLDVLPDLSEEDIKSKSKASGFAKTLVCIQALWFIAQCITRLAQHIPISFLELNTFGHAICTLLIYFLWWEKPFEVDLPAHYSDESLWALCAFKCMTAEPSPLTAAVKIHVRALLDNRDAPLAFLNASKGPYPLRRFLRSCAEIAEKVILHTRNFGSLYLRKSYGAPWPYSAPWLYDEAKNFPVAELDLIQLAASGLPSSSDVSRGLASSSAMDSTNLGSNIGHDETAHSSKPARYLMGQSFG